MTAWSIPGLVSKPAGRIVAVGLDFLAPQFRLHGMALNEKICRRKKAAGTGIWVGRNRPECGQLKPIPGWLQARVNVPIPFLYALYRFSPPYPCQHLYPANGRTVLIRMVLSVSCNSMVLNRHRRHTETLKCPVESTRWWAWSDASENERNC
jgi:hypothetical protein